MDMPKLWLVLALSILISLGPSSTGMTKTVRDVTWGSVFKLLNTAYEVRLHSHDVKYGSGSGQQSVTGLQEKEDVNSHWQVKGTTVYGANRGEPVLCGSKVRLEHPPTEKNLHSHHFSSPLSRHQEVSAFGDAGEGDSGDVWEVVCKGSSWKRDQTVQFRHIDTSVYLGVSGNTFGRPINGQYEVVGLPHSDASTHWLTQEGIFIHPSEKPGSWAKSNSEHTEL